MIGRDVESGQEVAIKLEHYSVGLSLLSQEVDIYKQLKERPGVPKVFWHGSNCDFQVMVFELLGPSLEDLLQYCGETFTLKTTLMLVDQMLRRIECLHNAGYIHSDIKPDNFLLGSGILGNVVYLVDVGLARERPDQENEWAAVDTVTASRHSLIGTYRYASINAHLGISELDAFQCHRSAANT